MRCFLVSEFQIHISKALKSKKIIRQIILNIENAFKVYFTWLQYEHWCGFFVWMSKWSCNLAGDRKTCGKKLKIKNWTFLWNVKFKKKKTTLLHIWHWLVLMMRDLSSSPIGVCIFIAWVTREDFSRKRWNTQGNKLHSIK